MDIGSSLYILSVIGVMTMATFLCRSMPFYILKHLSEHPAILYIGRMMPPMIMVLLVVYTLTDAQFTVMPYGIGEILACLATFFLHWRFKNTLLSIGVGTALNMIFKQTNVLHHLLWPL